jgi:hypothetical protein
MLRKQFPYYVTITIFIYLHVNYGRRNQLLNASDQLQPFFFSLRGDRRAIRDQHPTHFVMFSKIFSSCPANGRNITITSTHQQAKRTEQEIVRV